jgi:flagellin-like hook-associated protein FlgL
MSNSSIVLSAATRASLLSAQNTADLMATTQNRLSTGKKVNSALDNPTNFFTAAGLDSRANDLSNLLDGISNGVQTIQAASQGITNIQKLVDSAKSTANQALSTTITTTGTAGSAFSAPTSSTTITFSINGTSHTASITASASIDNVITELNAAAGASVFSKDSDGSHITVNATGELTFASSAGTALGFASAASADDSSTPWVDESKNSANLTINGLETRYDLASQYNDLLQQIDQLANDSSYNGTNLINSSDRNNIQHIQFNVDDTSYIDVRGVNATSAGIGLTGITLDPLHSFSDNTQVKATIQTLTNATTTLRSYASDLGSTLTVVQNRQDFSKNIINTLQTGSANLVNADLNEEAANSQALSTRQSLAISALSLANTAQQGVLQLLK